MVEKRQALKILTLLVIAGVTYWLLAPAAINGDGIGYLKQLGQPQSAKTLSPGHIAYLPIARQIAAVIRPSTALDLVGALRLLSLASALIGLLLLYLAARQLYTPSQALFATSLLAASNAYLRASHEVEVYGTATLVVIIALWAVVRYRARQGDSLPMVLVAAIAAGLAPSLHLTLVLLVPSVLLLLWRGGRRPSHLLVAMATVGVVGATPLLLALHHQGINDIQSALLWLRSSDHGIPYPLSPLVPLTGAWGLAKSLVRVPYPYQATLEIVGVLTALAIMVWLTLLLQRRSHRDETTTQHRRPIGLRFLLIWATPLTIFALFFYPSDTERWVFIMPVLSLLLAPAASRVGVAALVIVVLANLGQALGPALDDSDTRAARAIDEALAPGDLVISPGHGWTEMLGLSSRNPPRRFPLVFFVGAKRDRDAAIATMHERIRDTLANGGRVFVARLRGDNDARGFKELRRFDISRAGFADLFSPYRVTPSRRLARLWQLHQR